jgi:hypothetical protein
MNYDVGSEDRKRTKPKNNFEAESEMSNGRGCSPVKARVQSAIGFLVTLVVRWRVEHSEQEVSMREQRFSAGVTNGEDLNLRCSEHCRCHMDASSFLSCVPFFPVGCL